MPVRPPQLGDYVFTSGDMFIDGSDFAPSQAILVLGPEEERIAGGRYRILVHSYTTGRTYCSWYTAAGLAGLTGVSDVLHFRRIHASGA